MNTNPTQYAGNLTPSEAAAWLAGADSVVILTHTKPDGDAVGSSLALARSLLAQTPGRSVQLWYSGVLPDFLAEIVGDTPHRHLDREPISSGEDPGRVVVVDTGAWTQVGPAREFLERRPDRSLIIDHHLNGDTAMAAHRLIDTTAAAAAQIVAAVAAELLSTPTRRLPEAIATPLYLGLATDTGWFRHSNVRAPVLRLAADLIEAGVPHTQLYRIVEQRDRVGRLRLFGRAITTLEMHSNDRIGIMSLTEQDFAESGALPGDTGGFADRILVIESVAVAVVLNESRDHAGARMTKVSMRSKDGPGAVDVNQVTSSLGGGGHARAAGARIAGSLPEARDAVLGALASVGGM
ncbi:MAG: DHH family phosphoesterase [Phycisphaerales bacterium]|nr:DHH family phosphoesterase [Phycisphaerales bacterium]